MPVSAAAERNRFAQRLFAPLPARYDRLEELLSFGQNARWRRAMVDQILPAASGSVLDVATGTAGVALQIAARTNARVVGVDLTEQMLGEGRRKVAAAAQADRIGLVTGRAEQLPFRDAAFDALTFTYLLRYVADPQQTLRELGRVIRPGGRAASLEFCVPPSAFWRFLWRLYTWLLLPAGALLGGGPQWFTVGRFLGPDICAHYQRYPVAWTVDAWRQAGFEQVGFRMMSLGGGLVMWGTRAGD